MSKIHVSSDGTPRNTRIYILDDAGKTQTEITQYVKKVDINMTPLGGIVADIETVPPALDVIAMVRTINGESLEGMIVNLQWLLSEALELHRARISVPESEGRRVNWAAYTARVKDLLERGSKFLHKRDVTPKKTGPFKND